MIVRCGRCRVELEVSGPGEFVCPACGTRNSVRGAPQANFDVGGLTVPGGRPPAGPATPPEGGTPPGVSWASCPSCSFRFAMGELASVTCPNCLAELVATPEGLRTPER